MQSTSTAVEESEDTKHCDDRTSPEGNAGSGDIRCEEDIDGRSVMRRIIEQDCPPTSISYEYIARCTEDFAKKNWLGRGAFGEVYRGNDSVLNVSFAVKRILCELRSGAKQKTMKEAQKQFEQEIETLTYFRHPNIARMYAHYLDSDVCGQHCLVYELARRGSLDKFLQYDSERGKLPWYRRLHIALDISKALCYLHRGGRGFNCYHRDLKSANICLTRNYTAKLIDCGLSKLIADEGSQAAVTLSKRTTGASVTGTRGYICPKYNRTAVFTSQSEIFALGIVLIELATGTLQNHRVDGIEVDFFDRYIDDDTPASLLDEFDPCAGRWSDNAVQDFSALALDCIAAKPINRPTIKDVVSRLRNMARKYCELSPSENLRLLYDENARNDPLKRSSIYCEGTCQVCFFDGVQGLKCTSAQYRHFICNNCFEEHVLQNANEDHISCPIRWCASSPFSTTFLESHMTKETLLTLHQKRTLDKLATFVELTSQNLGDIRDSNREVNENLTKIQRGQLSLASGRFACPALFIITPKTSPAGFMSDPRNWFASAFQDTFYLYFLCGHDMTPIQSKVEMKMTRQWLRKMAPILKVAIVAIQLSMKATLTVSPDLLACIPFEGSNEDKVDALQKAIHPFIDEAGSQCQFQLNDIAEREDFRVYREEVYPFVESLALDQTAWRKEMVQVTSPGGILWVKKENEQYYLPKHLPVPQVPPPNPLHAEEEDGEEDVFFPLGIHCSKCCLQNLKRKRICLSLIFVLVVVTVVATVGGLLATKAPSEGGENPRPTEAIKRGADDPTRLGVVKSVIINGSVSSSKALQDQSSPQYRAATWLASNDTSHFSLDDTERLIQRYILAVFYYSTGGDGWSQPHSFMSGAHECDWHGGGRYGLISCDARNRTTALKFGYRGLTGTLPSETGALTDMVELRLGTNNLDGKIPSTIGMLTSLSFLDLRDNNFMGTVPSTFVNLTSLINITLEGNDLGGDLTAFCDAWDSIEYFSANLSKVTCPCCHCCNASSTGSVPSLPPSTPPAPRVSDVPSFHPTTHPTTDHPTALPTTSPSRAPLEPPTRRPETVPPTRTPSLRPTRRPTERPTKFPTSKPSKQPSPGKAAIKRYPNCHVEYPEWIGDGECDDGYGEEYNTKDCGWDGGDCGDKFHPLYPRCVTYSPDEVGDGTCKGGDFNTEECGWDGGDCIEYNELYPDCGVESLFRVGDGECDDGEHMTEECGWDGGDCADVIDLYPDCHVENSGNIGNGHCNGGQHNTVECGWDGGDCVDFNELYPHCSVENPGLIGNGRCDGGSYNTVQCGRDGGDCVEFNERYPNCPTDCPECVGDGDCWGGERNTEECGYDGGDCCKQSCTPGRFWNCEGPWDNCVDPKFS